MPLQHKKIHLLKKIVSFSVKTTSPSTQNEDIFYIHCKDSYIVSASIETIKQWDRPLFNLILNWTQRECNFKEVSQEVMDIYLNFCATKKLPSRFDSVLKLSRCIEGASDIRDPEFTMACYSQIHAELSLNYVGSERTENAIQTILEHLPMIECDARSQKRSLDHNILHLLDYVLSSEGSPEHILNLITQFFQFGIPLTDRSNFMPLMRLIGCSEEFSNLNAELVEKLPPFSKVYLQFTPFKLYHLELLKHVCVGASVHLGCMNECITPEHIDQLPADLKVGDLDLSSTHTTSAVLIKLIAKLNPIGNLNLRDTHLKQLTSDMIQTLPPDLSIADLNLYHSGIPVELVPALIAALKPTGCITLSGIPLNKLEARHLDHIPINFRIDSIDFYDSAIHPEVGLALINRLKITGDIHWIEGNFSQMTPEVLRKTLDFKTIRSLNLKKSIIPPKILLELLERLGPQCDLDLSGVKLDQLTVNLIEKMSDGFRIGSLNIGTYFYSKTDIEALPALALIKKLNPTGDINLSGVNLSSLTEKTIRDMLDDTTIGGLDLSYTRISGIAASAFIQKTHPKGKIVLGWNCLTQLSEDQLRDLPSHLTIELVGFDPNPDQLSSITPLCLKLQDNGVLCAKNSNGLEFSQKDLIKMIESNKIARDTL